MNTLSFLLLMIGVACVAPLHAFAASQTDVVSFTSQTLTAIITLASLAAVFFLIRGGFIYITSTGNPDALEHAKKTIRNAIIGLVLVLGAGVFSAIMQHAFITQSSTTTSTHLVLQPIQTIQPGNGLTDVLLDAITGFLQTIVQSATKPVVTGIISFLTTTPSLVDNSVVFNFWLVMVGIVDALFALVIALLGFHVMSTATFGFDELELKQLLPRIGLSFLAANTSLFVITWLLDLCNLLVQTVLTETGGLDHAWILQAVDPVKLSVSPGGVSLVTLLCMLLFIMLAITLLLFYISRLIIISVGAVLSPFICLLWLLPGYTDFAQITIKTYILAIFTVFIHVVIIQLASSFLTLPEQTGTNALISVLVGIAMFFTLLKVPAMLVQFAFYSASTRTLSKLGGQIIHVVSTKIST